MKRLLKVLPALAIGFAVAACEDTLVVDNLDNPDIERVFATPASIEGVIASGYQGCHNAHVTNADLNAQLLVLALESYSQLNNFFMGPRGGIPRSPVVNRRGTDGTHFGVFSRANRGGRLAVNGLRALDSLIAAGGTLGSQARNVRARSFAFFTIACNQGFLALMYDSAAVMSAGLDASGNHSEAFHFDSVPPLAGYATVMANAIAMLDSAHAQASLTVTGSNGFPLPDIWLSQAGAPTNLSSAANFRALIRSFRARFRAGVARTPAERAAVDWSLVFADANTGINSIGTTNGKAGSDFLVSTGGSTGWGIGFVGSQMHVEPGWSQMSLMYYGMADRQGGCYDAYIALGRNERDPDCVIITPDNRWPAGANRAAQQAVSGTTIRPTAFGHRPFVSNRAIQDAPGDPWGHSQYDFYRMRYIRDANSTGMFPDMTRAEIDLLAAEAYLHGNDNNPATTPANTSVANLALAAAIIDKYRVTTNGTAAVRDRNGADLPATVGSAAALTPAGLVPGTTSCVPRVPQPPNFNTTACGTLYEALKYEKRMETAYTGFGQWFIDMRGWGDLVENSPLHYPVPFAELDPLLKPYYGLGGGGLSSAARGTYGF